MTRAKIGFFGAAGVLAVLLGQCPSSAQSLKIERAEVARPGIYEIEVGRPIPDANIATGNRVEATAYKNVKIGAEIPARRGTIIGAEITIVGTPRRGKVPITVVWRYPQPGLTNPETKVTKTTDEYSDTQLVGEKFPIFWGLTQDWQLVPGTWTLEIFHDGRKLAIQQFQVTRP